MTRTCVMNWLMLVVSCVTVASSREKAFSPIRVTLMPASGEGGAARGAPAEAPGGGGGGGGNGAGGGGPRGPGRTPVRHLPPPAWRGCSSRRRGRRCSTTVPAQDWLRARQTPLPPPGGAGEGGGKHPGGERR